MARLTRRAFVRTTALATAAFTTSHRSAAAFARAALAGRPGRGPRDTLEELIRWVRDVEANRIVPELVDRINRGVQPEQLHAALFLAGIHDVEPRPTGFKLHCVMQLPAVWRIAYELPYAEKPLPLTYALADFKASQQADRARNDWELPPPPDDSKLPAPHAARAELAAACERWDLEAASAAATVLSRECLYDDLVAALLPFGMRSFHNAGHQAIFTAAAMRTLDHIGWEHSEAVFRSLLYGLLDPAAQGDKAASFAPARDAAAALVTAGFDPSGPGAPAGSAPLQRDDFGETFATGLDAMARRLREHPTAAALEAGFDTLEEVGLELEMENPGLFAVHAMTGVRALRELSARATDPAVRITALLQAAAWLPAWRKAFGGPREETKDATLQALLLAPAETTPAGTGSTNGVAAFDALLSGHGAADRQELARSLVAAMRVGKERESALAAMSRLVVAKAHEAHHYKFFGAVADANAKRRAADAPRSAARIAALTWYLPSPRDPDFEPVAEMRAALNG